MERRFKIGDNVIIKSGEWYNTNRDRHGYVEEVGENCSFIPAMAKYLGNEATIIRINNDGYSIDIDNGRFTWCEYMIEGLATKQPIENPVQPTLFDRIKSSILEAAKQAPVIVEQTEDGGIKISPIEDKNDDLPIGRL